MPSARAWVAAMSELDRDEVAVLLTALDRPVPLSAGLRARLEATIADRASVDEVQELHGLDRPRVLPPRLRRRLEWTVRRTAVWRRVAGERRWQTTAAAVLVAAVVAALVVGPIPQGGHG